MSRAFLLIFQELTDTPLALTIQKAFFKERIKHRMHLIPVHILYDKVQNVCFCYKFLCHQKTKSNTTKTISYEVTRLSFHIEFFYRMLLLG